MSAANGERFEKQNYHEILKPTSLVIFGNEFWDVCI